MEEWVTHGVECVSPLLGMLPAPLTENPMHTQVGLISVESPDTWILKLHHRRYAERVEWRQGEIVNNEKDGVGQGPLNLIVL